MHFTYPQKILFKHCDPAGIVFYPRFLEMLNDAIEAMFSELLEWPFEAIHEQNAVPTAELNVRFRAPCRHGDQLELRCTLNHVGRTSLSLTTQAVGASAGDLRFEVDQRMVFTGPDGRPAPWPEAVRAKLNRLMEANR
ncbi:acyl-CoA thioesterase [Leisingera thetidis]|uniref:acyl-CoA thioesterase n=1 Tax=Leisingera thetidis TaxID=2930199 RepID=UPI0021F6C80C|nr:thioesterase family protein [Leisingera thetidis]